MSRIKINTLQSKIEFIILSLGGKPDHDVEENRQSVNYFEKVSKRIQEDLTTAADMLSKRQNLIDCGDY